MSARHLALSALGLVALVLGGILALGGSDDGYIVKAAFDDAGGVRKNSDVKIGEVPAGRIIGVELGEGDRAIVTMKLDDGVGPIGAGATARSRPVNLLGEKYVDLDPGDLKRRVDSGTTIPTTRTATAVELDDILNIAQPGTRARLRILINEAGIALAGRGTDFNKLLEELPSGLDEAATFLDAMSRNTKVLTNLVDESDRVLGALTPKRESLGEFVQSAHDALAVTASRRAALGRTLAAAPGGLSELQRTLGQLQKTAADLRPAAANLRRTAAPLATTLRQLPAFARDARQTLTAATRVAPALERLGRQGSPTVRRLRPTLEQLSTFARQSQPVSAELAGGAMRNLVRFMNNWASITTLEDGISRVFRVRLYAGPDTLTGDKPGARRRAKVKPKARRDAGTPTAPAAPDRDAGPTAPVLKLPRLPDLPRIPDISKVLGEAPKEALEGVTPLIDGVTGKHPQRGDTQDDSQDVLRLLDYLFGT